MVAKELSKKHQQVKRFVGREWPVVKDSLDVRGEFVLLVHLEEQTAQKGKDKGEREELQQLAQDILQQGIKPKKLAKLLAKVLQLESKDVYKKLQSVDRKP